MPEAEELARAHMRTKRILRQNPAQLLMTAGNQEIPRAVALEHVDVLEAADIDADKHRGRLVPEQQRIGIHLELGPVGAAGQGVRQSDTFDGAQAGLAAGQRTQQEAQQNQQPQRAARKSGNKRMTPDELPHLFQRRHIPRLLHIFQLVGGNGAQSLADDIHGHARLGLRNADGHGIDGTRQDQVGVHSQFRRRGQHAGGLRNISVYAPLRKGFQTLCPRRIIHEDVGRVHGLISGLDAGHFRSNAYAQAAPGTHVLPDSQRNGRTEKDTACSHAVVAGKVPAEIQIGNGVGLAVLHHAQGLIIGIGGHKLHTDAAPLFQQLKQTMQQGHTALRIHHGLQAAVGHTQHGL